MGWIHGHHDRREITETIRDKETRRLEKTRKTLLRWQDCVNKDLRKAEEEKSGEKRPTTGTNGNKSQK